MSKLSVIIRSKDEAPRLRLTLASLSRQTAPVEIVVVDDGSSDATPELLRHVAAEAPLTIIRHPSSLGRHVSTNAGARAASGDLLLFLDGDTLAAPDLVERHLAAHARDDAIVGRGETHHLRSTRFLQDPETGEPQAQHVERMSRLSEREREALRVTRAGILNAFASTVDRRSQPGVYPGAGPGALYAMEMDTLRLHPECRVLWAAASGSNLSVRRDLFLKVDGLDEALDRAPRGSALADAAGINEHRDLAYRLCRQGARMTPVDGARTYHLTHRTGWRDPLVYMAWEDYFFTKHQDPAFRLLSVFWAGLSAQGQRLAPGARIESLLALEAAAHGRTGEDSQAALPLSPDEQMSA